MGRKKTSGKRTDNGKRLSRAKAALAARSPPNDRITERLDAFRDKRILAGKAAWIDIFDGIGQLHAIGMLDGHGLDGKLLREAGRDYIGLYNAYFIDMMHKGCDLERAYGGRSGSGKSDLIPPATRSDIRFAKMDDLLPRGSEERYWTHKLLLDYFGLDTVLPLVDRLVNYRFNQWKIPLPSWLGRDMRTAGDDDFLLLGHILRGLFALADGAMPERFERREAA
jgi:hypothetical protein